jgi:hypothetical protein
MSRQQEEELEAVMDKLIWRMEDLLANNMLSEVDRFLDRFNCILDKAEMSGRSMDRKRFQRDMLQSKLFFKGDRLSNCIAILNKILERYEDDPTIPIEKTYSLLITVYKDKKMAREA